MGRLVLDKTTRLLGAPAALLYRWGGGDRSLQLWAARGMPVAEDLWPESDAILRALDEGQPLILEGVDAVRALGVLPAYHPARQGLCLPIQAGNSVRALLCALRVTDRPFTRTELSLFNVLADRTGTALESIQLFAELEQRNRELQQGITERKRAEEALAEERNLLRTLMDNLPDFIFVKDTESRFVINNAAHLHALGATTQDELLGKTDFDIFPQELAAQYHADEREVIQSGQPLDKREEPAIVQTPATRNGS